MFPNILPRMNSFSTLDSRMKIWKTTLEMIKDHPLFGCGSQTYGLLYQTYNGHPAPHSHNQILNIICCYGISGIILLAGYAKEMYKEWQKSALSIGAFLIVAIHGILDCTISYPLILWLAMILINTGGKVFEKTD